MDNTRRGTTQKIGWVILLAMAGLITLNGPAWFFAGPGGRPGFPAARRAGSW